LDWFLRPVARGWCKYESLHDGALTLWQVAEMNDAIDLIDENDARLDAGRG
jgi:uncharacterized small protein (DUF1192 family)